SVGCSGDVAPRADFGGVEEEGEEEFLWTFEGDSED
ncbi:hypothetical protein A2U01_0102621, partial [Trifolium medium]|nr:hypothetical protein [Trifolium medium]